MYALLKDIQQYAKGELGGILERACPLLPSVAHSGILQICMRTRSHDTMEMCDMNHLSCQPEIQRANTKVKIFSVEASSRGDLSKKKEGNR